MGLLSKNVKNKNTCLLVNCPWLLVFAQYLFFLFLSAFNLYFWSNKHFSWSLDLVFLFNFFFAVVGLHLYVFFSPPPVSVIMSQSMLSFLSSVAHHHSSHHPDMTDL